MIYDYNELRIQVNDDKRYCVSVSEVNKTFLIVDEKSKTILIPRTNQELSIEDLCIQLNNYVAFGNRQAYVSIRVMGDDIERVYLSSRKDGVSLYLEHVENNQSQKTISKESLFDLTHQELEDLISFLHNFNEVSTRFLSKRQKQLSMNEKLNNSNKQNLNF